MTLRIQIDDTERTYGIAGNILGWFIRIYRRKKQQPPPHSTRRMMVWGKVDIGVADFVDELQGIAGVFTIGSCENGGDPWCNIEAASSVAKDLADAGYRVARHSVYPETYVVRPRISKLATDAKVR